MTSVSSRIIFINFDFLAINLIFDLPGRCCTRISPSRRAATSCRTCSWRRWLLRPSAQLLRMHAAKRVRVAIVSPRALHLLAQCDRARPMFVQIRVN